MDHDQNDFQDLRRLLALKRYEQPPPGYFQFFSGKVIARIQAGETAADAGLVQRFFKDVPWLQSLLTSFESRPVFSGAVSLAMCGLLVTGVYFSDVPQSAGTVTFPVGLQAAEAPHASFLNATPVMHYPSTNGLLPQNYIKGGSLFDELRGSQASQPAMHWAF